MKGLLTVTVTKRTLLLGLDKVLYIFPHNTFGGRSRDALSGPRRSLELEMVLLALTTWDLAQQQDVYLGGLYQMKRNRQMDQGT